MPTTDKTTKPENNAAPDSYFDAATHEIHRLSEQIMEIKKKLIQSEARLTQLQNVLLNKIQSKVNASEFPFPDGNMSAQSELSKFILQKLTLGSQIEELRAELGRLKKRIGNFSHPS
ncbi:hypothetical protein KAH55_04265 [bacterium]|nr:hypothetical protein [bacterium]